VKSPAPAGLFFTFRAAKQALDSNPASLDPLVGTRQPLADARGKSSEMNGISMHRIPDTVTIPVEEKIVACAPRQNMHTMWWASKSNYKRIQSLPDTGHER
jgi:hypothetical protein